MNRRQLFMRGTAIGAAALALPGCTTLQNFFNKVTPAEVAQVVVNDLGLIKNGAAGVLAALSAIGTLSAGTASTVSSDLTTVLNAVGTVAAGTAASAAQPVVQQIEAMISAVISALQAVTLPPVVQTILSAMQVLMPAIEAAVGIILPASLAPKAEDVNWARGVLAVA